MPAKSEHVNRDGPLGAFGALVLRGRQSRGWTVRDLARASGVGQNACSTAERGLHDLRFTSALKLAAALGIDLMAVAGTNGDVPPPAPEPATPPGRLARVEVKGFRDLGIVRVSETTLAGEPMLHAECDDGSSADFPPSSLHFITWLPEGAVAKPDPPRALGVAVDGWDSAEDAAWDGADDDDEGPF